MERETLVTILKRAAHEEEAGKRYTPEEEQELNFYLGRPGNAMVVTHVLSVSLFDSHLEVEARDKGTVYTGYDSVHAVLTAPRSAGKSGRGGVGF